MQDRTREIEKLLALHDPEELISLGAPQDEYRQEARAIARRLVVPSSEQELLKIMETVFHETFDLGYIVSELPDGPPFTKHALGLIEPIAARTLTQMSEPDSPERRKAALARAAADLHGLLQHEPAPIKFDIGTEYNDRMFCPAIINLAEYPVSGSIALPMRKGQTEVSVHLAQQYEEEYGTENIVLKDFAGNRIKCRSLGLFLIRRTDAALETRAVVSFTVENQDAVASVTANDSNSDQPFDVQQVQNEK